MGKFVAAFAVICREVSYNAQLTLDTFQILSFDVIIDCVKSYTKLIGLLHRLKLLEHRMQNDLSSPLPCQCQS